MPYTKNKSVQERSRSGGEDPGFNFGHVKLDAPLRYSGRDDRNVTIGFSNMDITGKVF